MREIHNLVKYGETAKRGTLGGHSHARGDSNYDMFRSLISCFFFVNSELVYSNYPGSNLF